jgi:hypothetical protein
MVTGWGSYSFQRWDPEAMTPTSWTQTFMEATRGRNFILKKNITFETVCMTMDPPFHWYICIRGKMPIITENGESSFIISS